ncbi:MAG: 4'-phosphopantetheinyl transferase superfamily protein [Burkholderia sp.]|nr:4'-phosphopantetheinyl transferase superfamily protein [Burkholderia sp.]
MVVIEISILLSLLSQLISYGRWPDDINVWHVNIPIEFMDWNVVSEFLNEDERLRAVRFIRSEDRLRFALTRTMLRLLLSQQVNVSIENIRFETGSYGKPALIGYPMTSFNVTHSGKHALIIISDSLRYLVGVDIEVIDKFFFWEKLVHVVCTDLEKKTISSCPKDLQSELFFKCWTSKEALLKAIGIGITGGVFQRISINPLMSNGSFTYSFPQEYPRKETVSLQFQWLTDINGCIGCIAFSAP